MAYARYYSLGIVTNRHYHFNREVCYGYVENPETDFRHFGYFVAFEDDFFYGIKPLKEEVVRRWLSWREMPLMIPAWDHPRYWKVRFG